MPGGPAGQPRTARRAAPPACARETVAAAASLDVGARSRDGAAAPPHTERDMSPLVTASRRARAGLARGFTLVEILCVVVIVGIAGAVVIPMIGSRDDLKAAAATRTLMADLIYAQNMSITTQNPHYIVFDIAAARYDLKDSAMTTIQHP